MIKAGQVHHILSVAICKCTWGGTRFTRLTNAVSKKIEKHAAMVHLFLPSLQFPQDSQDTRHSPTMEAGITDTLRDNGMGCLFN